LLGKFENFPETYHGLVRFRHQISPRKLQEALIKALHDLSREAAYLSTIHAVSDCRVEFDFGIADGLIFNYLDCEMLSTALGTVSKHEVPILDFLGVVRYYKKGSGKKLRPLKFDYYLFRFLSYDESVDFQIFHERGTRRLPIEDLSSIIIRRVNKGLVEEGLPKISVEQTGTP